MSSPLKPHQFRLPGGYYPSSRLNPLSKKIIDMAFQMGGSPGKFFKARKCNYTFPNGTACYDRLRKDADIDCPICRGKGVYFDVPIEFPVIVMDSVSPISQDKLTASLEDRIQMSIPIWVNTNVVEVNQKGEMHVIKDKVAVMDLNMKQWAVFTVDAEPFEPYLGGPLYRVINVVAQYTQRQDEGSDRNPKFYYRYQERDLLREINRDLYGDYADMEESSGTGIINGGGSESFTYDNSAYNVVYRESDIVDDWE